MPNEQQPIITKEFLVGAFTGAALMAGSFALGCYYSKNKYQKQARIGCLHDEEEMELLNGDERALGQFSDSTNSVSSVGGSVGGNIGSETNIHIHHHHHQLYHKPKRIFLIRHGESEGNINSHIYSVKPDNKIELTATGIQQADEAGKKLKEIIGDESVIFIVSPYRRSVQTFEGIAKHFGGKENVTVKEDPRLREQDFGNFQDPADIKIRQEERRRFGSFYYRFPMGESGSDVYCRVSSFCGSLFRSMENQRQPYENYVLVSHGLTCRLFLMRYFQWSVDTFHALWNLKNCQIVTMELQPNTEKYKLKEKLKIDSEDLLPLKDFIPNPSTLSCL